jgi:radical SAM protein with 4Fe4S-binding SPASM domain
VWTARPDVDVIDYRSSLPVKERSEFGAPLALFLDVTSLCQCRCWYCYNQGGEPKSSELTSAEITHLLHRFGCLGGMEVRLAGGEPTLHPDLPKFLELADSLALRTILVTNGIMAEPILTRLARAPVTAFYISIQGDEPTNDSIRGHGNYSKCVHSADFLASQGANVRLSMVFHKQNQRCVEHVATLAASIGADVAFNPLRPFGRATPAMMLDAGEHRRLVEKVVDLRARYPFISIATPWDYLASAPRPVTEKPYKRIGCGHFGLCVTVTGDCYSCGQLSTFPEFCIGDVRNDDLMDIWVRSRSACPLATARLHQGCASCPYLFGSACFGGCAATALVVRGALDAGDPYCFVELCQGGVRDCN